VGSNYDNYMVPYPWEADDMIWQSARVCADRREWRRQHDLEVAHAVYVEHHPFYRAQ